ALLLSRRQRVLLENRALEGEAGPHRDPPRRGRHPRLGRRGRRVLQPTRRRIWRPLAPQRPSAAGALRRGLHRAGQLRRLLLPRAARGPRSARFVDSGRHHGRKDRRLRPLRPRRRGLRRSEEHTSELQSRENLVCRLLLEKKKKTQITNKYKK